MANSRHLEILKKGVSHWNNWRKGNESIKPDLADSKLSGIDFVEANFSGANLTEVDLRGANLTGANLTGANLTGANLLGAKFSRSILSNAKLFRADLRDAHFTGANLHKADLSATNLAGSDLSEGHLFIANLEEANLAGANLTGANLTGANFRRSDLSKANLQGADLVDANFNGCILKETDFTSCTIGNTVFSFVDLKEVTGLETITHRGPSSMGIETIYISESKIPEVFMRGCGLPDTFISYIPSLVGSNQPIQFYSCFISYSVKDTDFAERLHSRMRQANLRVWYAPEDMKGGEKMNEQIELAIHLNDRLLVVLSENSMQSNWVLNEIRRALIAEKKESRRKLFPIRLVEYSEIDKWHIFKPNVDVEIIEEVRSYFIPDFSNWKNHDAFEKAFERLYNDLKSEQSQSL